MFFNTVLHSTVYGDASEELILVTDEDMFYKFMVSQFYELVDFEHIVSLSEAATMKLCGALESELE